MEKTEIYQHCCTILRYADKLVRFYRRQDFFNGAQLQKKLNPLLVDLLQEDKLPKPAQEAFHEALLALLAAQEAKDYRRLADLYTLSVRPLCVSLLNELRAQGIWQQTKDYYGDNYRAANAQIREMLDSIHAEKEDIPSAYALVEANTGNFVLQVTDFENGKNYFMDSADNPYEEAVQMMDYYCSGETREYILLGFSLGYGAFALNEREELISFYVYEQDPYILKTAFHYMDLTALLTAGKMKLIYDPALTAFAKKLSDSPDRGLVVHQPSMRNIPSKDLRRKVEDFFIHDSSVRNQGKKLDGNFYRNTAAGSAVIFADELKAQFTGRNMMLIAGGPSLDEHLPHLKACADREKYTLTCYSAHGAEQKQLSSYFFDSREEAQEQTYIIVCVGTVLKSLCAWGICPDYVVMTDPQENMLAQTEGLDTSRLSLIYLSTLYHGVVTGWKGKKYMALQAGYPPAEKMAADKERMLFQTGGSVSTLALDLGLRFGCKKIVTVGLDLAYVGGKTHACGHGGRIADDLDFRQVEGVCGGPVATNRNLDQYRMWIERRIFNRTTDEQQTELINLSRGARIAGMINKTALD